MTAMSEIKSFRTKDSFEWNGVLIGLEASTLLKDQRWLLNKDRSGRMMHLTRLLPE